MATYKLTETGETLIKGKDSVPGAWKNWRFDLAKMTQADLKRLYDVTKGKTVYVEKVEGKTAPAPTPPAPKKVEKKD